MSTREVERDRLRIAYCIDTLQIGGTELNAIRTAERLDPDQYDLTVFHIHADGPLMDRYRAIGANLRRYQIGRFKGAEALVRGVGMARFLRKSRIQVFHAHCVYSNIFGVPFARLAGVKSTIASRRWTDAVPRPRLAVLNRASYRVAHHVLANSPYVARLVEHEGVTPARIKTIPNFLDDAAFEDPSPADSIRRRTDLGIPADAFVIGCVARLVSVKGYDILIRAFAQLDPNPALRLVLIGDGDQRPSLERLAKELGVEERVHFLGTLRKDWNLHQLFDVSVLASRSEGFPNAVIEGMAAGRPVVSTLTGGIPDAIDHEDSGILVPVDDIDALGRALQRLVNDQSLCHSMAERGREVARERYQASSVIGRLTGWYQEMAGRS